MLDIQQNMGFNVVWCVFLLRIGTGICSVYMLLSWKRGKLVVQLWWQCCFSAQTPNTPNTFSSPEASDHQYASTERVLLSDGESLFSEHSSGSVVVLHTFLLKVVADLLFHFNLNLFLSPVTLFLL